MNFSKDLTTLLVFIASICRSLGFLTRLPIHKRWYKHNVLPSEDAASFPISGFLIGIWGSLFFSIAYFLNLGSFIAAIISYSSILFLTGALHEDGLSDTFDGFFAPKNRVERLIIMKDSRIGVFGALALILSLLLKISLLHQLEVSYGLYYALIGLISAEIISRTAMVWLWYYLPLAKKDGVALATGVPTFNAIKNGIIITIILLFTLSIPINGLSRCLIATLFTSLIAFAFMHLCRNKIGGITGDCLGAMQQLTVIAFLIGFAIS